MTLEELSRLDYDAAQALLIAYATDIKRYEKDLRTLDEQTAFVGQLFQIKVLDDAVLQIHRESLRHAWPPLD